MYANPKDIRTERINLSVSDAELELIKKLANERGLQPSVFVREVVIDSLRSSMTMNVNRSWEDADGGKLNFDSPTKLIK